MDSTSHPEHAGVHDTLRFGPRSIAHETAAEGSGFHPVQQRLERWDETRDNLKLTVQRNIHGMGAPIRTMMERKAISYVSCNSMTMWAGRVAEPSSCVAVDICAHTGPCCSRRAYTPSHDQPLQDPHFPALHRFPGNGIGGSTRGGFSQLQMDILNGDDEVLKPNDFLPSE